MIYASYNKVKGIPISFCSHVFDSGIALAYAGLLIQGAILADEVVSINRTSYVMIISLEGDIGFDFKVS